MKRRHWVYWTETGIFTGESIVCESDWIDVELANRPGRAAYVGEVDHLSQRIDTASGALIDYVPPAPADTADLSYSWNASAKRWVGVETLPARKRRAADAIDREAGSARLRFITDVPGQEGTYLTKASQAETYKTSGYAGSVPPYIQAEADATGLTPHQAADSILAQRDAWQDIVGPTIERLRRSHKIAIDAAIDVAAVDVAEAAGIAALRAITPT